MKFRGDDSVRQLRVRGSAGLSCGGVMVGLGVASALAMPRLEGWIGKANSTHQTWSTSPVRRADLSVTLTSPGKVDSMERTVIECQLERLDVSVKGQGMLGGGASTILNVIEAGTMVEKGDILCVLDA